MTALNRVPSLMVRAGTASALTIAAVGGSIVVPGVASDAAAATSATKALQIAASKKGSPYKWGATGPRRFDYPVAVGIIDERGARHVALDERSVAALKRRMNQLR